MNKTIEGLGHQINDRGLRVFILLRAARASNKVAELKFREVEFKSCRQIFHEHCFISESAVDLWPLG